MLIWTNSDSFANTYLNTSSLLQNFLFSNKGCFYFFSDLKGPGTSFQVAVFVEFFDKTFSFVIWHKLAKFH